MYWSSQLRGCSFQKARNFTASSHQNAGFSIWVFKKFSVGDTPDPHSGRRWPPPAPNTQPSFGPGVGHKRSGVGTQTLVPLNFSAVVALLVEGIVPLLSVLLSNYVSSSWMDEDSLGIVLSTNISCQPSSPHMLLIYCWVLKCFSLL